MPVAELSKYKLALGIRQYRLTHDLIGVMAGSTERKLASVKSCYRQSCGKSIRPIYLSGSCLGLHWVIQGNMDAEVEIRNLPVPIGL